jgi:hypothetical protein
VTPKRKASVPQVTRSAEPLYQEIRSVLESARAGAYRAVNATMVQAYWQVGRLIVEHEQKGRRRAGYGEAVIATLAERLTQDLGRGFDERNLWYMRSFHLAFPILNALRSESHPPTSDDTLVPAQRLPACRAHCRGRDRPDRRGGGRMNELRPWASCRQIALTWPTLGIRQTLSGESRLLGHSPAVPDALDAPARFGRHCLPNLYPPCRRVARSFPGKASHDHEPPHRSRPRARDFP